MKKISLKKLLKSNKYSKRWRRFYQKWKKVIIISSLSLLLLFFLFLYLGSRVSAVRADFARLRQDYKASHPCREACLTKRQLLRTKVINGFYKDKNMETDWLRYWQESENKGNYDFQAELLKIAVALPQATKINQVISEALSSPDTDEETIALVVRVYLSQFSDQKLVSYYFSLLNNPALAIKKVALKAISALPDKVSVLKSQDLLALHALYLNTEFDSDLIESLIYLYFELFPYFPEESRYCLDYIYHDQTDPLLRYLVVEGFRARGEAKYILSNREIEQVENLLK